MISKFFNLYNTTNRVLYLAGLQQILAKFNWIYRFKKKEREIEREERKEGRRKGGRERDWERGFEREGEREKLERGRGQPRY